MIFAQQLAVHRIWLVAAYFIVFAFWLSVGGALIVGCIEWCIGLWPGRKPWFPISASRTP